MAWTQARRRLKWSSFSEKTFWLLVNSARMSFLCHPRRKDDQDMAPHPDPPCLPRQPRGGPTGARGRQRTGRTWFYSSNPSSASNPLVSLSKPQNRATVIPSEGGREMPPGVWGPLAGTPQGLHGSCSGPGQAGGSMNSCGQVVGRGSPAWACLPCSPGQESCRREGSGGAAARPASG